MIDGRTVTREKRRPQVQATKRLVIGRFDREPGRYPFIIAGDFNHYEGKGAPSEAS